MKLMFGTVFTRLTNQYSIKWLSNKNFLRSYCKGTNAVKSEKPRLAKPNLYRPQIKKKNFSDEKIGIYGYSLLSIPIITFLLGTWQIQRRKWKLNLIQNLFTRTTYEPIELPADMKELESKEYYPIKVKGRYLYDKEFTIGPRGLILRGKPADDKSSFISKSDSNQKGYCIVTPFKLSDQDLTILVNRGWFPADHKGFIKDPSNQIKDEVEIVGLLRLNEKRPTFFPKNSPKEDMWFYRDINAMAEKAETSPIYIEKVYDKNSPQKYPIGGQTRIQLRNEHLTYIVTWYSLSIATAYMWYKLIVKKVPVPI
ncbi:surfeit locus protein 1 [Calliopsis andreniformis]|uniref:surfeit locus protein 1 n=1 Tax=Calliopsis andreniformis TaxID=337506 RepID=UPI003FCEB8B0